jgi:uncharacterized protein (TIGR04551 family)
VNPARDQQELAAQGAQRPGAGEMVSSPQEVFSEDWWGNARPIIEIHGYFRTRAELYHNFNLGRHSSSVLNPPQTSPAVSPSTTQGGDQQYLWPNPIDNSYSAIQTNSPHNVAVCGTNGNANCFDKTETSANLRLRLDPEIHISDNLRILTQLDLLNNLVMGSTPDSYANQNFVPANATSSVGVGTGTGWAYGRQSAGFNGYAPTSFFSTTQGSPTPGVNSFQNPINVNRAWAEYMTPLGELRFGRMPQHWGLGMLENSGDTIDSDYQSTIDRIMFVTGIKSMDLYFGAGWDFPSTGPTNSTPFDVYGGQPTNTCNLCNVNQWMAFIAHRTNPEIQKLQLAHGDMVLNGGLYALFRSQYLDVIAGQTPGSIDYATASNNGLEARQAWAFTPDVWGQFLWNKLRVEAEFVTIQGQIGNLQNVATNLPNTTGIHQYGLASQAEYRAIDDKLDMQFGFGFASGDSYAVNTAMGSVEGALQPPNNQVQRQLTQNGQPSSISTFRFNPDYRVDLIFYRNILSRVEGSYYFRPSVDYDFIRHPDGEKLGGGAAVIWSRASEFFQTPGHARDLGVELDLQLYYQSKDGSLNDDPTKIGGFFAMLQYGVFFPLAGLSYLPGQIGTGVDGGLSAAQTARLFLGVAF